MDPAGFGETPGLILCCECINTDYFLKHGDGGASCKGCGHNQCYTCDPPGRGAGGFTLGPGHDIQETIEDPEDQRPPSNPDISALDASQPVFEDATPGTGYSATLPIYGRPDWPTTPPSPPVPVANYLAARSSVAGPATLPSDSGYGTASHYSKAIPAPTPSIPSLLGRDGLTQDQTNSTESVGNIRSDEDARTVYTEAADLSDMRTESYISIFAEDILNRIGAEELDTQTVERLSSILPALLKALALKVGHEAPSQILRDMMVFVHKHRDAIAVSFRDNHRLTHESDGEYSSVREPPSTEILDRRLISRDEIDLEEIPNHPADDEFEISLYGNTDDDDKDSDIPGLEEYKKLIFNDPSYTWLLHRLNMEMAWLRAEPDTSHQIREAILQAIPRVNRVSRKKSSESVKVVYTVDWQILDFLHSQDYDMANSKAIASAITLTGSHTDAQALSCHQYMEQVWPLTGVQTLQLVQEMLGTKEHKKKLSFKTPTRLTLEARIEGTSVVVTAIGIPDFVAEIGEQLAWLGAALRSSPTDVGFALCTPYVDLARYANTGPFETQCLIKYRLETCESRPYNINWQCWHHLFANPVIVQGFPILRRAEQNRGLELPLDMLVALARARYIDTFKSKIFIKGFSTMLVPTKQSKDMLIWHLLLNKDPNERISYLDCGLEHANVQIPHLEQCRHILGWCSNAESIVGCALEKIAVTGGEIVTATATFGVGNREKPVRITKDDYGMKLIWISRQYFVFWDEEEKKGWLVDGANALLHILRASLKHSEDDFPLPWLLKPDALRDTTDQLQPLSALKILGDQENRELKLYVEKTKVTEEEISDGEKITTVTKRETRYCRLEDRIEYIYNILEKIIDYQADVERRPGFQINIWPRRQLEGWDFNDLVTGGGPFSARVANLHPIGKGWVDFTRTIRAVTLLGRGFGELIQPRFNSPTPCPRWSLLPSGKYHLAVLVSDLYKIMDKYGDSTSNPRRLCDNIIWHIKKETFDPCPCAQGINKCHGPVQSLFPLKFTRDLATKSQVALENQGAVIFGHSMNLRWYWEDSGDPVEGDLPPQPDVIPDIESNPSSSGSQTTSNPSGITFTGSNPPTPNSSVTIPLISLGRIFEKSVRSLSIFFGGSAKDARSGTPNRRDPSPTP